MKQMKSCLVAMCCLMAACCLGASPRKNLKQAEKLIGDYSKVGRARELVKEALSDSTFMPDAFAYNVAGRVEREAYRHFYKMLSINRKDPSVDHVAMSDALMDAYSYFVKCMELDSVLDKKGQLKVKYSPELADWISVSAPAMYNAGIAYMNKKQYYPKAYSAFIRFAELPDKPYYKPLTPMSDSIRANAFFYGGVMAYNAHEYDKAFSAFDKARKHGYARKEVYLNQISALSHIAKTKPTLRDSLGRRVTEIARCGLERHGVGQTPLFIQKYVAGMILDNSPELALAAIDTALVSHPDMVMLHTMKAGVYASMNRYDDAVAEYRKAADYETADTNTLKTASKYMATIGIDKLDSIKGRGRDARSKAKAVRDRYLRPALDYANRAAQMNPEDPEIQNTIETVTYRLH